MAGRPLLMRDSSASFRVYSLHNSDQTTRDYKKRKFSIKAKSGCLTCKAKRVKCDEARPMCSRCQRNRWSCTYEGLGTCQPGGSQSTTKPQLIRSYGPISQDASILDPSFPPSAKNGTPTVALLHHFYTHCTEIFQMPHSDEIFSLSKSHSLVRNTILAITACHLRHSSPEVLGHRIAEHFQQQVALRDYQQVLDTSIGKLGQSGADALILSGALLSILAFTLPYAEAAVDVDREPDASLSWVFSSRETRLDWLALQVGLKPFMLSFNGYFENSRNFLIKVFLGHDLNSQAGGRLTLSSEEVPSTWSNFFELDDGEYGTECDAGSPFYPPVKTLAMLRQLEPIHSNVFRNLQFLGKVSPEFRALLYDRNEKALWLFGYWLGLMCRYEGIWWCDKRVRRDYKAIRLWLERLRVDERPGAEGWAWKEMMWELEQAPIYGMDLSYESPNG